MIDEKEEREYEFWVDKFYYRGKIISENNTHWIIDDRKAGRIEIPKNAVRREIIR